MGYSPWGRKESDRTERLHFHFLARKQDPSGDDVFVESKLHVMLVLGGSK